MTVCEWVYGRFAVALLSMDMTRPFLLEMGLPLGNSASFQPGMRSLASLYVAAYEDRDGGDLAALAEALFEHLNIDYGRLLGDRFRLWFAENLFPVNNTDYWFLYEFPFSKWSRKLNRGNADPLQLGDKTQFLLSEYRKSTDMSDVHLSIRSVKREPLSAWDKRMYELMNFDNDEDRVMRENGASDDRVLEYPFEPVICATERHRFQTFWEKAVQILDESELARVKAVSEEFWKVPLPEPRSFRCKGWPPFPDFGSERNSESNPTPAR